MPTHRTYSHVHTPTPVCALTRMHMHVHTRTLNTHMHIRVIRTQMCKPHMYTCSTHTTTHAYTHAPCVYAQTLIHTPTRTQTCKPHMYTHAHTHTFSQCTYVCMHKHSYTYPHAHEGANHTCTAQHTRTHVRTCMLSHVCAQCSHAHMIPARLHVHTRMHAQMNAHVSTGRTHGRTQHTHTSMHTRGPTAVLFLRLSTCPHFFRSLRVGAKGKKLSRIGGKGSWSETLGSLWVGGGRCQARSCVNQSPPTSCTL